jgi:hypothetical protein
MTIGATLPKVVFTTFGADTFAIPFAFYDKSELKVYRRDATDPDAPIDTLLVEGLGPDDYQVLGVDPVLGIPGTDIELQTPLGTDEHMVLLRVLPLSQLEFSTLPNVAFPNATLERTIDRLAAVDQQQQVAIDDLNGDVLNAQAAADAAAIAAQNALDANTAAQQAANDAAQSAQDAADSAAAAAASAALASTWFTGSGAPGALLGDDNDLYLDTDTSDVYQKLAGTWTLVENIAGSTGPQGAQGDPGPAGAQGTFWYTGSTAPAGGLGNLDDLYLRTTTGEFFRKTGVSTWTSLGTLSGQGVPTGGTTGQVLTKNSATDYDTSWATPADPLITALIFG